ncbi:MAG: hypothetical protein GY947_15195 [Rhodobacteraceae bacterium]|nr:hypothetical protein [Paracoccaceae bacterium]
MNEYLIYLPGLSLAFTALMLGFASPGPSILTVIGTAIAVARHSGLALA